MSEDPGGGGTEAMIALRGELAALQYKRDRLLSELADMRNHVRCSDQKNVEIESEADRLREQTARQNAIVDTLKHRVQDLEERERALSSAHTRAEAVVETLERQHREDDERIKELSRQVRDLEAVCHDEQQAKMATRAAMADVIRRLATALGEPEPHDTHVTQDCLLHKAADLIQMVSRLRSRTCTITDSLESTETELRSCREALERAVADRENFQRQAGNHLLALDRLKQEKDEVDIQRRLMDREMAELREKLSIMSKELVNQRTATASQDAFVTQLKGDLLTREEKVQKAQAEMRHLLETLAITLSTPARFVESSEEGIRARIRELIDENKDRRLQIDSLKEKIHLLTNQLERQKECETQFEGKIHMTRQEKALLEGKLQKLEDELHNSNIIKENLRRDKNTFLGFLENLGRVVGMDDCKDGEDVDLLTESLLIRSEQLARMETNRIVDKLLCHQPNCIPCAPAHKLKRERSYPDICCKETSAVYQLQRRVRTLKEQVQKKDLHLDLLRRKLAQQEENCRVRSAITSERDEAALKCKKMAKQIEKLQSQLLDTRTLAQDLRSQLSEAGDLKITALERGRKIEELQQRLVDSELLRTRYNKKIQMLKDQLRSANQSSDQERTIAEHSIQLLRDDLASSSLALAESKRKESQLETFRAAVSKTLGCQSPSTDYEIINKLEKVVAAHREFTLLSRRYEESVPCASPGPHRTPRYEDSGFIDPADLDDHDDVYHKRASRLTNH